MNDAQESAILRMAETVFSVFNDEEIRHLEDADIDARMAEIANRCVELWELFDRDAKLALGTVISLMATTHPNRDRGQATFVLLGLLGKDGRDKVRMLSRELLQAVKAQQFDLRSAGLTLEAYAIGIDDVLGNPAGTA